MAKGNVARAAILLCVLAYAGASAQADEAGCAALAGWVKAGVMAAARDRGLSVHEAGNAGSGGRLPPLPGGRYICSATAAVSSRAFGEALRGLNVQLAWNGDWIRPGDYCLSHHLDQCYPSHNPFSALPPPSEFAFVHQAWRSVTRALASQMPYGTQGDLSSFSYASLDTALSAELHATFGGAVRAGSLRDTTGERGRQRR